MSKDNSKKELELGTRKVGTMNYSKVVTLPRAFTDNYLDTNMIVSVSMTHDGKLVLTPKKQT